ncbi:Arc family DNA-binding protein [Undibacterium sp. MH2W]|uniref:Arc family DNA-binding protein n=1 Tax=Undibacterium sp. MH2W TaxID=3413044 RepID=UPI003BF2390F
MEAKNQQMAYPLRMPPEIRSDVQKLARENDRSLNSQLVQLVRLGLKAMEVKQNAAQ